MLIKTFYNSYVYMKKWSTNIIKKNKEELRKEACERYQNLSEEEKEKRLKRPETDIKIFLKKENNKKHKYNRDRNKNLSEEENKKKVEYIRNYCLTHK